MDEVENPLQEPSRETVVAWVRTEAVNVMRCGQIGIF